MGSRMLDPMISAEICRFSGRAARALEIQQQIDADDGRIAHMDLMPSPVRAFGIVDFRPADLGRHPARAIRSPRLHRGVQPANWCVSRSRSSTICRNPSHMIGMSSAVTRSGTSVGPSSGRWTRTALKSAISRSMHSAFRYWRFQGAKCGSQLVKPVDRMADGDACEAVCKVSLRIRTSTDALFGSPVSRTPLRQSDLRGGE
jgi:hypothetical protein